MSGTRWLRALLVICFLLVGATTALAEERFKDNGDGTVTDQQMGLMWAKGDNQGDITWKQAVKWVTYTLPLTVQTSYENWRLPTVEELQTLYIKDSSDKVSETDCGMRVRIVKTIELSCGWVWSAENKDISASVFSFKDGYHFPDLMMHDKAHRALAVRNVK